jgi:predicted nuclease with TOPRIM domain
MATGVGIGFDLSKLESEFKKLDEQLGKLMKKGETFKDEWNEIFTSMGKDGLSSFASQLAKMRKDVVSFGKVKVGI